MSHLLTIILIYNTEAMEINKEYIKKMIYETLTVEEQNLLALLSVICQTIYIEKSVAEAVLKIHPIESNVAIRLLTSLTKYIVLQPLTDMITRQQYFLIARLFLTYLMDHWDEHANNSQLTSLFSDAVIAFASNVELSFFGNKRQLVHCLEERIDFKLLAFLKELDVFHLKGVVCRLLGELYTEIFRYNEAEECFAKASTNLNEDADLFMAEARMYENLGIQAKAFQFAYRAYLLNKKNENSDANIKVSLYISYLCAVNESEANSKYWRNITRSLIGNRNVPSGHIFNITLKEIEALIHLDDAALAHQILDSAELGVYQLYGGDAPEMARISYIRSLVDGETGQLRKSNEHYRRYVHTNHLNYGYSVGDTVVLYSAIISDNVIRGNNQTANIFAIKMQDLYAEGSNIAPGVRLSQAFANCASNLADETYELSDAYLEMANKIYVDELKPDVELLAEITPVFHNGIIPKSVLMTEEARIINIVSINICLGEGRFDDAKKLIEKLINEEKDTLELLKWNVHMGRVLILEGKQEEGVELWQKTLVKTPKRDRFELCKQMAEWASYYSMNFKAKEFYEEALLFDIMVYAKSSDIAEALQNYAKVLNYCGFNGSEENWEQAVLFMESVDDKDGLALLYLSWGVTRQDNEAERLIKKAISYWHPESGIFDETLSNIYHHLACAQAMQGKHDEALRSAQKATRLYPTEYPSYLMEDMG